MGNREEVERDMSTNIEINLPICKGCGGRGWVDSMFKGAQLCPICLGTGVQPPQTTLTRQG